MEHSPECAVGKRQDELCPTPHELSDGKHHWWSGWPNAYCLGCGTEHPAKDCPSECSCQCHKDKAYGDGVVVGVLRGTLW